MLATVASLALAQPAGNESGNGTVEESPAHTVPLPPGGWSPLPPDPAGNPFPASFLLLVAAASTAVASLVWLAARR